MRPTDRSSQAEVLARLVTAVALVLVALLLGLRGASLLVGEVLMTAPLATASAGRLTEGLIGLAAAVAALALAVVAIRPSVSAVAARSLFVVCAAPAVLLVIAAGVVQAKVSGCDGWRPDEARLQSDVADGGSDEAIVIAAGMVRCRTFDGASRRRMRALLGSPQRAGGVRDGWSWQIGTVNDTFGLGDGEYLTARFERDRVADARLSYSD